MGDEKKKRAAVGSRERIEQLGELVQEILSDTVALIEFHVPTDEERREQGMETRRAQVVAAAQAYAAFSEGWKQLREAHGR